MADTITLDCGAGATPTVTPGLAVNYRGTFGDEWRLIHQESGTAVGEFLDYEDAQDAATALSGVADWTAGAEALQDERVIWQAIDAIEEAGGRFLCRKGGLGEQVEGKRAEYLASTGGGE